MKSLSINSSDKLLSTINLPPSKSYANRALIIAALNKKSNTLFNLPEASDVTNLLNCFKGIGLETKSVRGGLQIINSFPSCEGDGADLDVGDGGTTARFLAAMLLLGKKTYTLKLGKRLKDRPWSHFISLVKLLGAKAELVDSFLKLQGPLKFPPNLEVDCSETTQFATAFQLIFFDKEVKVSPLNLKSSISYWNMTEEVIREMNANDHYHIPMDWSSASYPLAFGALNQTIEFPGLKSDEFQADCKFLDILESYEAISYKADGSVVVKPARKSGPLSFDVSDALDLVPSLSFFLAHIPGIHELKGIKNLHFKESDRLKEVIHLLKIFGRSSTSKDTSLIIEGHEKKITDKINLIMPDDHRMVMTGTLFLLHHNGGSIEPTQAVEKSYPEFFTIIN